MKRRILLVDDDVAVLLTMKAVLEISGFDVDTAASAREGKHKVAILPSIQQSFSPKRPLSPCHRLHPPRDCPGPLSHFVLNGG